ncbi:MAG: beta-lactamase family protein [Clostridia bacterium]|nr:beta-lactamase family protein [Clostridia bacterium]
MKKSTHRIIIVLLILCISVLLSIPGYISRVKSSKEAIGDSHDLWKTSDPIVQGVNPEYLKRADLHLSNTNACSFIVIRDGKIVFEKYYNGVDKTDITNTYSITKNIVAALIGMAIENQYIKSTEQKVSEFFPEYFGEGEDIDARKNELTIKHLLTMTSGFQENWSEWGEKQNRISYAINQPIKYPPGEKFQYANTAYHLLSGVLAKSAKKTTLAIAEESLFQPLGIKNKRWEADQQQYNTGYANLYLSPRDIARFGLLYLNNGMWEGKQIVPKSWVKESLQAHTYIDSEIPDTAKIGYGYNWFMQKIKGCTVYYVSSYGGQNLCIIPDMEAVVVITGIPGKPADQATFDFKNILEDYIIPAVKGSE